MEDSKDGEEEAKEEMENVMDGLFVPSSKNQTLCA